MKLARPCLALLLLAGCARAPEVSEDPPPLPVKLEKVARAPFQPTLVLLGVVRPAGEAQVVVPAAGTLRYPERFRDGLSSGLQVRAGEVIARLLNNDTEQGLAEARLRLEAASKELARYQRAFESGVVPAAQVASYKAEADLAAQRLEAARQRHSTLDLRSPVTGWLLVEQRLPGGSEVQAGTLLARVAAGGGLPAPGEGVELHVELDPRPQAMTVPEEALVMSAGEGGSAVYVKEGKIARRRAVTTGSRSGGRVEILSGLSPGDKVVAEGAALLSEGAEVTEVEAPAPGEA